MRLGAKQVMKQYMYKRKGTGNNNVVPPSELDLRVSEIIG